MITLKLIKYLQLPSIGGLRFGHEDRISYHFSVMLRQAYIEGRINAVFTHIANEAKSSVLAGKLRKAIGMLPGAADWIIANSEVTLFIELKAGKNKQSEAQKLFQDLCIRAGIPYYVCYSVEEAESVLIRHNILKPKI